MAGKIIFFMDRRVLGWYGENKENSILMSVGYGRQELDKMKDPRKSKSLSPKD